MTPLSITDVAEIAGLIRDIAFVLLLLLAILVVLMVYRKVSTVLDSARRTMRDAEEIVSTVSHRFAEQASSVSALASGAGKVVAFLLGLSGRRRKGGTNDGR